MPSPKSMCASTRWCSICGLKIPHGIVSGNHPLYGSVDHVLPRSRGGPDALHNRAPAHRVCNSVKGGMLAMPVHMVYQLQATVAKLLNAAGEKTGPAVVRQARLRINLHPPQAARVQGAPTMIMQWEDDGGAPASF